MSAQSDLIEKLTTLNHIAETLNQAVDVRGVLDDALSHLVDLMGLETGWIFLKDPEAQDLQWGRGYVLAAHHNLPPALELDSADAWGRGCTCQDLCARACLNVAYNEVQCSRLNGVRGDRRGLAMHASTPLRAGNRVLGILNVAGPTWASFSPEALTLLTSVGGMMGNALERARLFDLLQERRIHEQAVLLDLSQQLLGHEDLDDLIDYLVQEVRQVLEVDACALLLPGEEPGFFDFRAASGWRQDPVAEGRRVSAGEDSSLEPMMHAESPPLEKTPEGSGSAPWMPDWLQAEGFRGQAVVPLLVDGRSVGALMVGMRQTGTLDGDGTRLLRLMGNQAAMAIEKARLHEEEVKAQGLERELSVGRQIQLSLLPKAPPVVPGWEFATFYEAARLVGGDFYDFFELPGEPGRLGIVIADVAGKGVPAALFMALSRTIIRSSALNGRGPAAALVRANELILKDSRSDLFLTAFYAVLDTHSGRLAYANAGHNPPLWLHTTTGKLQELTARGIVLGALEEIELEEREIEVEQGDLLVFYTDGATEAIDANRQPFGEERLQATIAAKADASPEEVLGAVVDAVRAFTGDIPAADDVTFCAIRRRPENV